MIIFTDGISAPFIFVMSPKCFMFGKRFDVTCTQNGSISEAQTGVIPHMVAARGKPPEPSNRLPNVNAMIYFSYFTVTAKSLLTKIG